MKWIIDILNVFPSFLPSCTYLQWLLGIIHFLNRSETSEWCHRWNLSFPDRCATWFQRCHNVILGKLRYKRFIFYQISDKLQFKMAICLHNVLSYLILHFVFLTSATLVMYRNCRLPPPPPLLCWPIRLQHCWEVYDCFDQSDSIIAVKRCMTVNQSRLPPRRATV